MKLPILLIALSVFHIFSLFAQTKLVFLDKNSDEPVPGVLIKIAGQENKVSDANGTVVFSLSKAAFISFSHIAYEATGIQVSPGQEVTVFLNPTAQSLGEVVVTGFESERPLVHQAGAISKVLENELYRFNENSILSAFNTKPGIRIEQRAPASYRISIRGSSLRSPFGVRNVKVYWNDIPFTSPDGTTALNILDLSNIQNSEVIKGPAGSIYGAGNGGVISFESRKQVNENRFSTEYAMGDFGLHRFRIGLDQQIGKGGVSASYVHQKSDGYREHSAMDRKVFQLALNTQPSEKQTLSAQVLYSDLNYQIPGALTRDQVEEDRRQARPGSVGQNSSIAQKTLYGTLSHELKFHQKIRNNTALYANTTEFENPFILDYKRETAFSYGGRTKFTYDDIWGDFPVKMIGGGEYQYGKTLAQNFGNRQGKADTIRFSDDLITAQAFLFGQLEIEWTSKLLMTLGLSNNYSRYEIDRQIDAGPNNPMANSRTFDPILIPRLALVYKLSPYSGIYASISSGFSPPTIAEVRTNEGSINLDLEAERGTNYEMGYRGSYGIFNVDLTAFYFKLNETITTFTNDQGVVLFQNAGATDQRGIEVSIDYSLYKNQLSAIQKIKLNHAFTGHYFKFADYSSRGNDFSGNQLTGVSPNTLVNLVDIRTKAGIYLNMTHQYVDEIPLNDANTVFQDAYNLLGGRLGWMTVWSGRWDFEVYGGVENLLDETYSLGNDLNAFANRFFQPAPGRNWYGGVKLGFRY
ncbi:TonB-dependent receptor domain-containing protein [Cecembia lonarensis]|uniref:Outer membrane cobalamin receptor protein n=1 Tax=Cecembia lonarensis (strain CCUG 58316 / KCTC 22772 / LW9) TaxID=1225176 RepID=K1L5L1_CECL9|nr:TonB-dependent receptor [Cecembia lonarensis]EKB47317.1 Outer membrane cobalamin receptor protein [Cecembia lonarensis LW9]